MSEEVYTKFVIQTAFGEVVARLALNYHLKEQNKNLVRSIAGSLNSDCTVEETSPDGIVSRYLVKISTKVFP